MGNLPDFLAFAIWHRRYVFALNLSTRSSWSCYDFDKHNKGSNATHRQAVDPSRVFVAGLLTGREDARTEAALRATIEAYEDLTKVKAFWR